jgi:hypothetical protein
LKKYPKNEEWDPTTFNWTKYKIVVPSIEDYDELKKAFRHFHDSDINTDYVTVNQLAHEYLDIENGDLYKPNIIIDKTLYNALCRII